jgi:hypothetical protein
VATADLRPAADLPVAVATADLLAAAATAVLLVDLPAAAAMADLLAAARPATAVLPAAADLRGSAVPLLVDMARLLLVSDLPAAVSRPPAAP